MKNLKLIVIIVLAALLAAGGAGAFVWWKLGGAHGGAHAEPEPKPAPDYKYVNLDKVLIMLRSSHGDSGSHYLSMDLVFKSLPDQEKRAKEHLPLLRAITVRTLSSHSLEDAQAMTVDQFAEELNKAFKKSYAEEHRDAPFDDVLIGKLIIE